MNKAVLPILMGILFSYSVNMHAMKRAFQPSSSALESGEQSLKRAKTANPKELVSEYDVFQIKGYYKSGPGKGKEYLVTARFFKIPAILVQYIIENVPDDTTTINWEEYHAFSNEKKSLELEQFNKMLIEKYGSESEDIDDGETCDSEEASEFEDESEEDDDEYTLQRAQNRRRNPSEGTIRSRVNLEKLHLPWGQNGKASEAQRAVVLQTAARIFVDRHAPGVAQIAKILGISERQLRREKDALGVQFSGCNGQRVEFDKIIELFHTAFPPQ